MNIDDSAESVKNKFINAMELVLPEFSSNHERIKNFLNQINNLQEYSMFSGKNVYDLQPLINLLNDTNPNLKIEEDTIKGTGLFDGLLIKNYNKNTQIKILPDHPVLCKKDNEGLHIISVNADNQLVSYLINGNNNIYTQNTLQLNRIPRQQQELREEQSIVSKIKRGWNRFWDSFTGFFRDMDCSCYHNLDEQEVRVQNNRVNG